MNIVEIAARVMLCTLHTGAWRATRQSKTGTRELNDNHATGDRAKAFLRVSDHPALAAIGKVDSAAYEEHARLTIPSCQDGMRIVPVQRQFEHGEAMRAFADTRRPLVTQFLGDYEHERATAPGRLNGLYDARMWPDLAVVQRKFKFATDYLPCPVEGTWAEWLQESARAAEAELRDTLRAALQRVVDRCSSSGKLYQSVFSGENGSLKELCALIPDLNITGAADIIAACDAARDIAESDVEIVRDDSAVRKETADKASRILACFGQ